MEDQEVHALRVACKEYLNEDALAKLLDANLSLQALCTSDPKAMAYAKRAGLSLPERAKLREALQRHRASVLSAVEPEPPTLRDDDHQALAEVARQRQLALVRARRRAEEAERARGAEVIRNGAAHEGYRWTQELAELTVALELPPGTTKDDVVCKIGTDSLCAGLRGQPPVVDGALHGRLRHNDALWQLVDSHRLIITLPKWPFPKLSWWPCLVKGELEINTDECREGESTNLYSGGGERRLGLQKIELGGGGNRPPIDAAQAEREWKNFFERFPEMRAYELRLDGCASLAEQEEALLQALGGDA